MAVVAQGKVYVLGDDTKLNKEVIALPVGSTTDLPSVAEYNYTDTFTKFPY